MPAVPTKLGPKAPVPSAAAAALKKIKDALPAPAASEAAADRPPTPLQQAFAKARQAFSSALIERDDEIDLVFTALIAGEHALLVGPPGVAKSLLIDSLLAWLGGRKFSLLMTKFTTPEEVFGPISLTALKADKFLRVPAGKLPEADFLFLDEVFKASSAVLNTLLKVLNERVWDAGDGIAQQVPLQLCLGASNEWPGGDGQGQELSALFDRFLLRKQVKPVNTARGRAKLLFAADSELTPSVPADALVTLGELAEARAEAAATGWSKATQEALKELVTELAKEGVKPGDRRQRKTVKATQAFAWLSGSAMVEPEHLEIARHTLWDDPFEHPKVVTKLVSKIAAPAAILAATMLTEGEEAAAAVSRPKDFAAVSAAVTKLDDLCKRLEPAAGKNTKAKAAFDTLASLARELKKKSLDMY